MTKIIFDLEEFKRWLVDISPDGGGSGLYNIYDDEFRRTANVTLMGDVEDGEIIFSAYRQTHGLGIVGRVEE